MKLMMSLVMAFLPGLASAAQSAAFDWVLAYSGRSENELMSDQRTERMIAQRVPATLSKDVIRGLSGPPDPVYVVDSRFVSMSACQARNCGDKGFFWIDTQTGVGLGALLIAGYRPEDRSVLRLASNGMRPDRIPAAARNALIDWLSELEVRPDLVEFSGSSGETTELNPLEFKLWEKYVPAAGGPSFDCRNATSVVARVICQSPRLSKADLDLFRYADGIRRGSSYLPAREELAALQDDWIRRRDSECAAASDIDACVSSLSRAQHDTLSHWVPRRTMPVASSSAVAAMSASGNADSIRSRQRAWLANERNKCPDVTCIEKTYTKRLAELSSPNGTDIESGRSGAPKTALPALEKSLKEWAAPDPVPACHHALADLNDDGRMDAIVLISDPDYCGSGGCTMVIFQGTAQGFKYISRSTITNEPVQLLPETSHGWHTLVVSVSGGGATPGEALLRFSGSNYPLNPTVQPYATPAELKSARSLLLQ